MFGERQLRLSLDPQEDSFVFIPLSFVVLKIEIENRIFKEKNRYYIYMYMCPKSPSPNTNTYIYIFMHLYLSLHYILHFFKSHICILQCSWSPFILDWPYNVVFEQSSFEWNRRTEFLWMKLSVFSPRSRFEKGTRRQHANCSKCWRITALQGNKAICST